MSRQDEINCLAMVRSAFSKASGTGIAFDNTDGLLRTILDSCKPNPAENDFPDFLLNGGAVEHFMVGSSEEGKKGAEFNRLESQNISQRNAIIEKQKAEYLNSPTNPGTYRTYYTETLYEDFSYDAFLKSLERNLSTHVDSLKKSGGQYDIVAFLMEQETPRLGMYKNGFFSKPYLLFKDKEALRILAKYSAGIRCVIYFVADVIEAIDLKKIPELMAKAEEMKDVRGGRYHKGHLFVGIDI